MSSSDSSEPAASASNKKRVQRACDMCRRKKRRCDGGEKCDHCRKHNFICTYIEPATSRPNPSEGDINDPSGAGAPTRSYVEALEARLKTVEALLEKARTERSPGVQLVSNAIHRLNSPYPIPHSDDLTFVEIDASFRALSIDNTAAQGFHGKSSGAMLVKAAVDLRKNRNKTANADGKRADLPPYRLPLPVPGTIKSWEAPAEPPPPTYSFPPPDLLHTLISLYFDNVNAFLPLLHRPTFLAGLAQNLHLTHGGFAKTLLLVCAVGARYCAADARVGVPGADPAETAGWVWFDQVELAGHLVRAHPTLYDLQSYCLAAAFLDCTASPRTCWTLVGFGMRLSQDIGAHRFKMRGAAGVTFEQELEKRASWVLFLFDAQISTALGRCIALQSHDFDIELPIVCDDEYWGDPPSSGAHSDPSWGALSDATPTPAFRDPPPPAFRQPPDKPSRIAFFNCMLQLNRILSFSCKILYSTNRSKMLIGLGDDKWEEQVVVELDSALNTWFEGVPAHLRWDPDAPIRDPIFFDQSAVLYCTYYHTRIIIHRPFIPAMRRAANPTHLPSLAICNTAARACSHVAQVQQQRRPHNPVWFSQTPLFTAGIVLLLNIWGGSKSAERDLTDVHRCMTVLEAQRTQWPSAGALLDTLRQLVAVDHPLAGTGNVEPAPRGFALAPAIGFPSTDVAPAPPPPVLPPPPDMQPFGMGGVGGGAFAGALSPPRYDPLLETAPPADLLGGDDEGMNMWFDPAMAFGDQNQDEHALFQQGGYVPQDGGFLSVAGGGYAPFSEQQQVYDLGGGDVNMDAVDLNTVALWSRAPTGFGVADWDMYLGRFMEDDGQGEQVYPG
ncbi:fungal-specific transcription factor domain-containing protein [Mycena maculata]|uniref:Fungal-specific transcription factor domain-containing protein n=1 Tax=Mycena maculata TaxID=230809 RepID=A0AAD7I3S4_9AGAR|nr:fungal-specific transcription factor domain-containing protein [Mycena maculata]